MKRRWKIALGIGGALLVAAIVPIAYIETSCSSPLPGLGGAVHRPLVPDAAWHRDESRTWLTYPEWHIVYSAESFGRFLENHPPSGYSYWRDVRGFWSSYCAVNRAAAANGGAAADARIMLYTIGLSYSAELLVKAAYENTIGRLSEWLGGWHGADDHYAMQVQQRYGAFMHETPWYEFPFGRAFTGLWKVEEPRRWLRHWERREALSLEYGVKAGYAKLIGFASGASLGRDERTLRFVARADPAAIAAIDPRFKPVDRIGRDLTVVEAPRYAQFTDLLLKMAATRVQLTEISGNDDIFMTALLPPGGNSPAGAVPLMAMPLADRTGWRRVGLSMKVPDLLPTLRAIRASGGEVEHVYDY